MEPSRTAWTNTGQKVPKMSELTGSNYRRRAQFKCAQTVVGQRSAGNGPNGLSYTTTATTTTTTTITATNADQNARHELQLSRGRSEFYNFLFQNYLLKFSVSSVSRKYNYAFIPLP